VVWDLQMARHEAERALDAFAENLDTRIWRKRLSRSHSILDTDVIPTRYPVC
jgi:hypothetical protein